MLKSKNILKPRVKENTTKIKKERYLKKKLFSYFFNRFFNSYMLESSEFY